MQNVSSSNSQAVNVPKLRFPGFEEEWNTVKLGCAGNFYGGLTGKSKDDFGCGTSKYITYKNVFSNTFASENILENVNVDNNEHQNHVENGDVLFTQSSETFEEVGMSSVWLHDSQPYLNSFCMGWRPNLKCLNSIFMGYLLRCPTTRTQIIRQGQGISRINLAASRIADIKLCYPQIDEQNKIAQFLKIIDNRIEKQQELVDALKLYKRGAIKHILSKITNCIKLKNIVKYHSSAHTQNNLQSHENGKYPVYDATGIFAHINTFDIDSDYIAIIKDGSGVGRVQYCVKKSTIIGTLGALIPIKCSAHFLIAVLETIDFTPFVIGAAIPHVYFKDYGNLSVPFPDEKTQSKISNIYSLMAKQIQENEKVLNELTNCKKALLQQMFI